VLNSDIRPTNIRRLIQISAATWFYIHGVLINVTVIQAVINR